MLSGLAAGVVVALSGCSSDESSPTAAEPTATDEVETDLPATEPSTDGEPTPTDEAEPETTPEDEGPQPPDPRFIVRQDGSGDYDSLQDAYDVAADGDVIEIGPGSYSYRPTVEAEHYQEVLTKSLVMVGQSAGETTVRVEAPSYEDSNSAGQLTYSNEKAEFWRLTLDPAEALEFNGGYDVPDFYYAEVPARSIGYANASAYDTVFTGSFELDSKSPAPLEATDCTFTGEASIAGSAENCVFQATYHSPYPDEQFEAMNCEFQNGLVGRDGDLDVRDSTIRARDDSGVAVDAQRNYRGDSTIVNSVIEGKVVCNTPSDPPETRAGRIKTIEGCRFSNPGNLEYFIDGFPVSNLWRNAFVGADVRLKASPDGHYWDEVTVFDGENEVGNYYSEWDGGEDRGDGISELPRPIPGSADAVDQYPLMSENIDQYA